MTTTLSPVVAGAQTGADKARAEALLNAGNASYDRADFRDALAKFKEANSLYPTPEIELNIGLTFERLADLPAAATHFERFLSKVVPAGNAGRIRGIRQKLQGLRKKLGAVTVVCPLAGATVTLDGAAAGKTPLAHRLYVAPGRHTVVVTASGRATFEEQLTLAAGQHRELKVKLPLARAQQPSTRPLDLTAPPPARPRSRPFYRRWWFWTAVGVAVAGATAAVVATQTGGDDRLPRGELADIDPGTWRPR